MCKNGGYENTKQKCRIAWIGLEMNGVKIGGDLLGNLEMPNCWRIKTIYCPNCGVEKEAGAVCPRCGESIVSTKCPHCGYIHYW